MEGAPPNIANLGPSPKGGHYVAVARHVTSTGEWWLYDDSIRRQASDGEVDCTALYNGSAMKAYVLFYTLQSSTSGEASAVPPE